jgi:glutamyl-tRNA synthetase
MPVNARARQFPDCTCAERDLPFDRPDMAWRLRLSTPCEVTLQQWPDGERTADLAGLMRAPVLRQRDGRPSYQIASLADDVDQRMTAIVRGEDLLPSTACQLRIAELMGMKSFAEVRFLHHELLTDVHGNKLSKSAGASALKTMREGGKMLRICTRSQSVSSRDRARRITDRSAGSCRRRRGPCR